MNGSDVCASSPVSPRWARGLANASRYVARRVATASGTSAEMRVVPSPWRRIVIRVRSAAAVSRSASRVASAASATSGATTSRTRRPIRPSSLGPNSPAQPTRCTSARAIVSASTAAGSASRARRMTWAWARVTAPSRIPAASIGRSRSKTVASARSARASANRVRVWCASHPAASFAPVESARSPASARTRNRSSASCASAATSSRRAAALSVVDMNVGFAPATPFRTARMSEAAARIG